VDEKCQIQALDRTQKTLPMQPGHAEQRTHDYVRHGTATLFAALEVATAKVTGLCTQQHRHQEFLVFSSTWPAPTPTSSCTWSWTTTPPTKPQRESWLADHPRIHIHFTPASGSWLNLVQVWFEIIERQTIRPGSYTPTHDLMAKIQTFITGWNHRKHPFMWTKTANEILNKIDCKRKHVSTTSH
jgi:transposase